MTLKMWWKHMQNAFCFHAKCAKWWFEFTLNLMFKSELWRLLLNRPYLWFLIPSQVKRPTCLRTLIISKWPSRKKCQASPDKSEHWQGFGIGKFSFYLFPLSTFSCSSKCLLTFPLYFFTILRTSSTPLSLDPRISTLIFSSLILTPLQCFT